MSWPDVTAFTVWDPSGMVTERIVVGATGAGDAARGVATTLRDAGHEVVFVGGRQTPEQLARTAVAEDAARIVVEADAETLQRIRDVCERLGAEDVVVGVRCDAVDAT
jgi:methylmalonyl-CoA mutase C-terminal domain/subunit